MPYYHIEDSGKVGLWNRKCEECGKKWSIRSYFMRKLPKDMVFIPRQVIIEKGKTSYASWGDKFPGAALVASHLPAWPRWFRVLTVGIFVLGVITVIVLFIR